VTGGALKARNWRPGDHGRIADQQGAEDSAPRISPGRWFHRTASLRSADRAGDAQFAAIPSTANPGELPPGEVNARTLPERRGPPGAATGRETRTPHSVPWRAIRSPGTNGRVPARRDGERGDARRGGRARERDYERAREGAREGDCAGGRSQRLPDTRNRHARTCPHDCETAPPPSRRTGSSPEERRREVSAR
jgi:hypothetical protein